MKHYRTALGLALVFSLILILTTPADASGIKLAPAQDEGDDPVVVTDYANPYYNPTHDICTDEEYFAYNPAANTCREFIDVTQDWINIYEALQALKEAGGGKLKLGEGTFLTNTGINIEDFDLAGGRLTIKGADTDDTTIRAVSLEEGFEPVMISWGIELTLLLQFDNPTNGEINLKDLTMEVLDTHPSRPYWNPWDEIDDTPQNPEATSLNNLFVTLAGNVDVVVKNVRLLGRSGGDARGANLMYGFIGNLWSDVAADVTIKDSEFSGAGDTAVELWALRGGSSATIKDSEFTDSHRGVAVCVDSVQGMFDVSIRGSSFSGNTYDIASGPDLDPSCADVDNIFIKDSDFDGSSDDDVDEDDD